MRILHITARFLPDAGGVQWSVFRTAEAQALRGHDVTVITESPRRTWNDDAAPFSILRFHVPTIRPFTRLLYWRWMWQHRSLLTGADVLHFHDYTPLIHWFLPLRPLIRQPHYAITFHGYEHWPIRARHRLLRHIAARVCASRFAVGDYIRRMYGHPVDAVYIGAPVRDAGAAAMPQGMRFAYAGRLEADTEILLLAETLSAAARGTGTAAHLEIVGDGSLRPRIEALDDSLCSVHVHGAMENPVPVLSEARYVFATGFLGMLEAFQLGRPVIFPALNRIRREYARSVVGASALMTVAESPEELREVLEGILDGTMEDIVLARMERARAFVSQHTWDDIAVLLESQYRRDGAVERSPAAGANERSNILDD